MPLLSKFSSKVAEKPMVGTFGVVLHHLRVKFVKFSLKVPLLPLYNWPWFTSQANTKFKIPLFFVQSPASLYKEAVLPFFGTELAVYTYKSVAGPGWRKEAVHI